jgi:hypothetical protein
MTNHISFQNLSFDSSISEETITIDCDADLIVLGPHDKLLATAVGAGPAKMAAQAPISPVEGLPADAASRTPTKAAQAAKATQAAKAAQADKAVLADTAAQAQKASKAAQAHKANKASQAAQAHKAHKAAQAHLAVAANEAVRAALAAADIEGEAGEEETPRETDEPEDTELEGEESGSPSEDEE